MPRSIADIRRANGGLGNLTDEEILQATYQEYAPYYKSLDDYASAVGYGGAGRGLAGSRVSSGIDQYQANLYGLGGAVSRALGADGAGQWFDRQREANEQAAGYANQRAQDLGAVDDWRDVSGVGSGLNYLGGLAAQSLPYLGEAAVGALTGGVGLAGTAGRLGLSRAAAATLGATAASYPSAVGDVLSAQRDAGGEDLGMAAVGGVPYAALNALGVEGLVARGFRPLATGQGGLARRMATGGGVTALGEGIGETGQELVNQSFGRMAVDPNETLFNEEANRRYLDSFVGGAALGGAFGAVGGVRRPRTADDVLTDPTLGEQQGEAPRLGYSPLAGTPIVFPDGSVALNGEQELMARYGMAPQSTELPAFPDAETGTQPAAGATVASEQQVGKTPTTPAISLFDDVDQGLTEIGIPLASGKKTREKQRSFYQDAVATGIPLDSDLLTPYWTLVSENKWGDKTKVALQNAIVQFKKQGQPDVSTPSAPAGQPAGPSAGRGPDAVGSVVNPGPVPPVNEPVRGNAGGAQPAGQSPAVVADTTAQRAPAVTQPLENRSMLAGATPATPPVSAPVSDPFQVSDQVAPEKPRFRKGPPPSTVDPFKILAAAPNRAPTTEEDLAAAAAEARADLEKVFGERDTGILYDVFTNNMPHDEVATKYGVSRGRVAQIAGMDETGRTERAKKMAKAEAETGMSREYLSGLLTKLTAMSQEVAPQDETDVGDTMVSEGVGVLGDQAQADLGAAGFGTVDTAGGSEANWKDSLGKGVKIRTRQKQAELEGLRDAMAVAEEQLDDAKVAELAPRIAAIENETVSLEEKAAANTQMAFELSEKARELEDKIAAARAAGQDSVATKNRKLSLAEAEAEVASVKAKVQEKLDATAKVLTKKTKVAAPAAAPAAPVSADLAAAKQKFKDVGRDVTKMEPAELQMLRGEAERFKNKELLAKIDAQLGGAPQAAAIEPAVTPQPAQNLPVAVANTATPVAPAAEQRGALATQPDRMMTVKEKYEAAVSSVPGAPAFDTLPGKAKDRITDLANRDQLNLAAVNTVLSSQPQQLTNEPVTIDVEARVVEETLRPQLKALGDGRLSRLEKFYGVARDSAEFLAKVKEDVVTFATKGAEAVNAAIRDVIKALHAGVLSAAMIFNPTGITSPEAYAFIPPVETVTITREVRAELPAEVQGMSEAGKQAYATLVPALKGKNGDKLLVMADKPSGRMFVFDADGKLVVQKKTLFGLAKGDFYKGNNDLPQNRITPAGLFGLQLVDAAKGGSAKVTAGDYDFGKVFALQDPDAVVTIMHSVWLKEKDAGKRAAALKNDNPADSRYSFGCINVDKDTYKFLLDNYQAQMDGAKLFVVPDNQEAVKDFVAGTVPSDRLVREGVQPVTETVTTTRDNATQSPGRTPMAPGREQDTSLARQRIIRASRRVLESTDADGTDFEAVEASLDDLKGYYPGIEQGVDYLRDSGLGNAVDAIDSWMVTFSPVGWDAIYSMVNGRRTVIFNGVAIADQVTAITATIHEVGHAVDTIHDSTTTFSGSPEFNLRRRNGEVVAMKPGSVVSELIDHYFGEDSALSQLLAYPLNSGNKVNAAMGVDELREELFAQAWAFSNLPGGMDFLRDNLPATAAFMETVHEQVKATNYARPQNAQQNAQPGQVPDRTQAAGNVVRASRQAAAPTQGLIQKNISKLPPQAQKPVRASLSTLQDYASKALDRVVFTGDLIGRAVDAGLKSARTFRDALVSRETRARELEREVERIADMYALVPKSEQGDGPGSVNQFLFDSTRLGKWGYDSGSFKADPEMAERFDKLDEKSQAFIKAVFAHGDKMLALKKKTVLDTTNSEYDARIADAKARGDAKEQASLENEKKATIKKFQRLFSLREGKPYAPIKRTGNYVVVAKSSTYRDAEANKDTELLRKLEQDADHYNVTFTDTKGEARALAERLREAGVFGPEQESVDFFEREDLAARFSGGSMLNALTKLRSAADARAAAKEPGAARLQTMVSELYLEALAEGSARKSEMRRRGIAGEVDMLRSFAQQGRADSQFLASVQYNGQIQDAIQAMRKEADQFGNRDRKTELFNELTRRYQQVLEQKSNPWLDKLTRLSSVWFLATSPAYYMQNLTQPWMMSVPMMAGRFDYTKVTGELVKAYGELKGVLTSGKAFKQSFDLTKVPGDVRDMVQKLVNEGKIDIGLESEMGEFQVEGRGAVRDRVNKIDRGLRLAVQKVETINRLSTAIAALRLEKAGGASDAKALEYAAKVLDNTHGDYTAMNAPRFFNTQVGKVALQFRKFQLIQLSYYAKLINDVATNPAERKAALKTLGYMVGHTLLLAGVRGLPGFAAAAWALGYLLGDDDEKFDFEGSIRKAIGDSDYANLIMRGAPTLLGADISGKVGSGNMLSILPFSDADLTTTSGRAEAFGTLIGGASLGLVSRLADGAGLMLSGDWYRGLETMAPKGIGDFAKALREANTGMTRRNGDVLLSSDEISFAESAMQALGVQPVQKAVTYERQQRVRGMDQNFQERATEIKNEYVAASRGNDAKAKEEARQAWTKLQEARVRNGYTRQPISELIRAPMEAAKRQRNTVGGVQVNRQNRQFVEQMI